MADEKEKPSHTRPKLAAKHEDHADVDFMEHTMTCPVCDELGDAVAGQWGCATPTCKMFGRRFKPSHWNRISITGRENVL